MFGDVSLSDGIIEYAKTHEELKGAFLTFQKAGIIIRLHLIKKRFFNLVCRAG